MLVEEGWQTLTDQQSFVDRWRTTISSTLRWAVPIGFLGVAGSWIEWWTVAGRALLMNDASLIGGRKYDWGVKCLDVGSGESFGCRGNAAFGFMAFTLQGMSIVVLFLFCALMIQFAVLLWYLADPDTSPHLLPDLDDARDRRRGFQQFEAPLESMLLVVFG